MMQTLARVAKIAELPTLTTRTPMQRTPIRIDGAIGVPVLGLTCERIRDPGSRSSRAIENISREHAV